MKFKKVGPGLYERTDTPKRVEISEKFADAVRREGKSSLLERIIVQPAREGREREK
jgi:hypothetical protein